MAHHKYCTLEHHQKILDSGFVPESDYGYTRSVGELSDGTPDSQFLIPVLDRLQNFQYWVAVYISSSGVLHYVCGKGDNFQDPVTALVTAEARGWRAQ